MRKAEKQPKKQEREDTEDEKPVVVGDAEALPSQQAEREALAAAGESGAAQASGKVVFNADVQKKRKHVDGSASGTKGVGVAVGAAKALKNTKLLSFDAED